MTDSAATMRVQCVVRKMGGAWRITARTPTGTIVLTSHGARDIADVFRAYGDACALHAAAELDRLAAICKCNGEEPPS